jgi:chromosome segregation ATPase
MANEARPISRRSKGSSRLVKRLTRARSSRVVWAALALVCVALAVFGPFDTSLRQATVHPMKGLAQILLVVAAVLCAVMVGLSMAKPTRVIVSASDEENPLEPDRAVARADAKVAAAQKDLRQMRVRVTEYEEQLTQSEEARLQAEDRLKKAEAALATLPPDAAGIAALEERLHKLEDQVKDAVARELAAENRAAEAEERAAVAEINAKASREQARDAEERATAAEISAKAARHKAREAKDALAALQQGVDPSLAGYDRAQASLTALEDRVLIAESRAAEAERRLRRLMGQAEAPVVIDTPDGSEELATEPPAPEDEAAATLTPEAAELRDRLAKSAARKKGAATDEGGPAPSA